MTRLFLAFLLFFASSTQADTLAVNPSCRPALKLRFGLPLAADTPAGSAISAPDTTAS
jgi:hypothetical protein